MAFVMTRNTRKSLQSGVYTPVKSFNAVVRLHNNRYSGRLCGLGRFSRANALSQLANQEVYYVSRLLSAKTCPNHFNQINKS